MSHNGGGDKGMPKPSNRAAALLAAAASSVSRDGAFAGSGAKAGGSGSSSAATAAAGDMSAGLAGDATHDGSAHAAGQALLPQELQLIAKKLAKKDPTTRLRGLEELLAYVRGEGFLGCAGGAELRTFLEFWRDLYVRRATDPSRRIRAVLGEIHRLVVEHARKETFPVLKDVLGPWLCAKNDPAREVARTAAAAFDALFPGAKFERTLAFAHASILAYLRAQILQPASAASAAHGEPGERQVERDRARLLSPEEQELNYIFVLQTSFWALRELVCTLGAASLRELEAEYAQMHASKEFAARFLKDHPSVAMCAFDYLLAAMDRFALPVDELLRPVLDSLWARNSGFVNARMMQFALACPPHIWAEPVVSSSDAAAQRPPPSAASAFCKFLRSKSYDAASVYPAVPELLARMPQFAARDAQFLQRLERGLLGALGNQRAETGAHFELWGRAWGEYCVAVDATPSRLAGLFAAALRSRASGEVEDESVRLVLGEGDASARAEILVTRVLPGLAAADALPREWRAEISRRLVERAPENVPLFAALLPKLDVLAGNKGATVELAGRLLELLERPCEASCLDLLLMLLARLEGLPPALEAAAAEALKAQLGGPLPRETLVRLAAYVLRSGGSAGDELVRWCHATFPGRTDVRLWVALVPELTAAQLGGGQMQTLLGETRFSLLAADGMWLDGLQLAAALTGESSRLAEDRKAAVARDVIDTVVARAQSRDGFLREKLAICLEYLASSFLDFVTAEDFAALWACGLEAEDEALLQFVGRHGSNVAGVRELQVAQLRTRLRLAEMPAARLHAAAASVGCAAEIAPTPSEWREMHGSRIGAAGPLEALSGYPAQPWPAAAESRSRGTEFSMDAYVANVEYQRLLLETTGFAAAPPGVLAHFLVARQVVRAKVAGRRPWTDAVALQTGPHVAAMAAAADVDGVYRLLDADEPSEHADPFAAVVAEVVWCAANEAAPTFAVSVLTDLVLVLTGGSGSGGIDARSWRELVVRLLARGRVSLATAVCAGVYGHIGEAHQKALLQALLGRLERAEAGEAAWVGALQTMNAALPPVLLRVAGSFEFPLNVRALADLVGCLDARWEQTQSPFALAMVLHAKHRHLRVLRSDALASLLSQLEHCFELLDALGAGEPDAQALALVALTVAGAVLGSERWAATADDDGLSGEVRRRFVADVLLVQCLRLAFSATAPPPPLEEAAAAVLRPVLRAVDPAAFYAACTRAEAPLFGLDTFVAATRRRQQVGAAFDAARVFVAQLVQAELFALETSRGDDEHQPSKLHAGLLGSLRDAPPDIDDDDEDEDNVRHEMVRAYLVRWLLVFAHFEGATYRLKAAYLQDVKASEAVGALLDFAAGHLRMESDFPVDLGRVAFLDAAATTADAATASLRALVALCFHRALQFLPSLVQQWHLNHPKRALKAAVARYTEQHFSPALVRADIEALQRVPADTFGEEMAVKPSVNARQVSAVYHVDEFQLEMIIKLPREFPLRSVTVEGGKKVGVSENQWRGWLLAAQAIMTSQNGTLLEALLIWKQNAQRRFEGIDPCPICYAVIGSIDMRLPNKTCGTCKKIFHTGCMVEWFKKSTDNTCPYCRQAF